MKKIIRSIVFILMVLVMNMMPTYAMQTVMSEEMAIQKSRVSYLMNGTDGKMYNVYIVGDNESYDREFSTWKKTPDDRVYKATTYGAYVCDSDDTVSMLQSVQLFGEHKTAGGYVYMNLTNPSYVGGIYLIKGVNGEPDILVSAAQLYGSGAVDYRCFVIKNGSLKQLKFMDENQSFHFDVVGTHQKPYTLDDGTIAFPWFRRTSLTSDGRKIQGGSFTSVFMPDFTNLILIHGYTYKRE